jgi:hypothetical protein
MNGHWRPSLERRALLAIRLHRRPRHWANDVHALYPRYVGSRPANPRALPAPRKRTRERLRRWRRWPYERSRRSGLLYEAACEAIYCYRLGWKLELEAAARTAWRATGCRAGSAPRRRQDRASVYGTVAKHGLVGLPGGRPRWLARRPLEAPNRRLVMLGPGGPDDKN